MATSEYLRNESSSRREGAGPTRLRAVGRHAGVRQSVAAAALIITNDVLMILGAFCLALLLRLELAERLTTLVNGRGSLWATPSDVFYLGWFILAYILVARRYGLYSAVPVNSGIHELRLVIQGCLNAGLLLCGMLYMFHAVEISRILVILLVMTSSMMLCLWRAARRHSQLRQFEEGIDLRNVVILGTSQLSCALARHIEEHRRLGYRFVGFIGKPGMPVSTEISAKRVLGGLERLRPLTRQHFIDEVVIAEFYPTEEAVRLVQDARDLDIDVRAIAGYYGDLTTNAPVEYLGIFPVAALHRRRARVVGTIVKRAMDIVLSSLALFATAPLLLVIALAVRLDSPGPALYVADRIGKRGRVFRCFKFRTMVQNAEKMKQELAELNERDGVLFKCSNDPRVTRLGRFLRKYSLDELPQFLNVLRGEMSIVGPRPPIASEVEKYELEHFRRLEVMPGLTGLWQVQARHDPSFAKYIELDTAYVENWSVWLDVKILLRTATVVVQGTGT
ncbi:MAG: sugar transferase [Acidobacteriaceae bacterium]